MEGSAPWKRELRIGSAATGPANRRRHLAGFARPVVIAAALVLAVGAACADDDTDADAPDTGAEPGIDDGTRDTDGDTPGNGDAAPDDGGEPSDPGTDDPDHGDAGAPEHGSLAALTSEVGEHLATRDAWAVYVHVAADSEGTSACTGSCLDDWPILRSADALDIAGGVDEDQVGTVEREDGTEQLAYAGFPLHLYAGEEEPGQAIGHGSGDEWSVISPDGELLLDTPAD